MGRNLSRWIKDKIDAIKLFYSEFPTGNGSQLYRAGVFTWRRFWIKIIDFQSIIFFRMTDFFGDFSFGLNEILKQFDILLKLSNLVTNFNWAKVSTTHQHVFKK